MGDLTKNLSRWEIRCKCGCSFDTLDIETAAALQDAADHFQAKISITSGCRCLEYNEKVQLRSDPDYVPYSSKSQHMFGRAVDFFLYREEYGVLKRVIPMKEVYQYLNEKYSTKYGIGRYSKFIHLDTATGGPRRW